MFLSLRHVRNSSSRYLKNRSLLSTSATPEPPLFSLRTRMIFYSTFGGAVLIWSFGYWLNVDRENVYKTYEKYPKLIQTLGPYLGVPLLSTGELDRETLGPRDIRDLVGERVHVELILDNGSSIDLETEPRATISQLSQDLKVKIEDIKPLDNGY